MLYIVAVAKSQPSDVWKAPPPGSFLVASAALRTSRCKTLNPSSVS